MLLSRLAESLRSRMQEHLLGDTRATGDEPIPPQYQEFVDRYYRALAAEGKDSGTLPVPDSKEIGTNK